jgi:hypothetical protein
MDMRYFLRTAIAKQEALALLRQRHMLRVLDEESA